MAGGERSAKKAQLATRRAAALELRKQGGSFRQIAEALKAKGYADEKYSHVLAFRDVDIELKELAEQRHADAEVCRTLELERLDALLSYLWPRAKQADGFAISQIIGIVSKRCALLGLDRPSQVQIGPITDEDVRREVGDNPESAKLARDFLASLAGGGAVQPGGSGVSGE